MELTFSTNADHIKLTWRLDNGPYAMPLKLPAIPIRKRSAELREALSNINAYMLRNLSRDEERDPNWREYSALIRILRQRGEDLYSEIFELEENLERAQQLLCDLETLEANSEIKIHCSGDDVSLPVGFIYNRESETSSCNFSLDDFKGFWLSKYKITMLIQGSGCSSDLLTIDPTSFRSLFTLHKSDFESAIPLLNHNRRKQLEWLLKIKEKYHYSWLNTEVACSKIVNASSIFFIFAHSDGDNLELDERDRIGSTKFGRMISRDRGKNTVALIILNCCLSITGAEQRSLLSAVARRGFCGLIGTEAEIVNVEAINCGVRLMWGLCAEGLTLGDAFEEMKRDKELFPLNLLYTCYAERSFKLHHPLGLME